MAEAGRIVVYLRRVVVGSGVNAGAVADGFIVLVNGGTEENCVRPR